MKRGFKQRRGLQGVLIAVAAVMAFAPQASADPPGDWLVAKAKITASLLPLLAMKVEGSDETLLSKIVGIKVEKLCTAVELIEARLEVEGRISSGAKVRLSGCQIKLNGSLSKPCEPHSGAEKGVIVSKPLKGVLALHEGAGIVQLQPASGTTFMTFETGEECAIGESIPVGGTLVFKDAALTTEATEHLIVEGPLNNLWFVSNTPEHKVTFDGSALVTLAGEHTGQQWSGLPG